MREATDYDPETGTERLALGRDRYPFDGDRMIEGNGLATVANRNASLPHKVAERNRAWDDSAANNDVLRQRLLLEVEHFRAWLHRPQNAWRPQSELLWGNCVRETGILHAT